MSADITHSEEAAFLDAIAEHPDDDTSRLIYADWLEEYGDARCEFIRAQCELATLDLLDDRRWDLEAQEQKWLATHAADFIAPLVKLGVAENAIQWHRGLIYGISLPWDVFEKNGDEIFAACPTLLSLEMTRPRQLGQPREALESAPAFSQLMQKEGLKRIHKLNLSTMPIMNQLVSADLPCLRELKLSSYDSLGDLHKLPVLGQLESLNLAKCRFPRGLVEKLAKSESIRQLKSLNICSCSSGGGNPMSGDEYHDSMAKLVASPHLTQLEKLKSNNNSLRLRDLTAAGQLPNLKSLCLAINWIEADSLQDLVTADFADTLEELDIACNPIENVRPLIGQDKFPKLAALDLSANRIGSLLNDLDSPGCLPSLRWLEDSFQKAKYVRAHKRPVEVLDQLHFYRSRGNSLDRKGLKSLLDVTDFAELRSLDISSNNIGNGGVWLLCKTQKLPQLRQLNISCNVISEDGFSLLASSNSLPNLRVLDVSGNRLPKSAALRLLESWAKERSIRLIC